MGKRVKQRNVIETVEPAGVRDFHQIFDADTGERLHAFWQEHRANPSGRPPGGVRKPEFFRVYRTNWRDVVHLRRLTMYERGVLVSLMAFLSWESPWLVDGKTGRNLSESDVADLLGLDAANCRKVLKRLCDAGFVSLSVNGAGRPLGIRINSHLMFFGKDIKDAADHAEFDKAAWEPPVKVKYAQRKEPSGTGESG